MCVGVGPKLWWLQYILEPLPLTSHTCLDTYLCFTYLPTCGACCGCVSEQRGNVERMLMRSVTARIALANVHANVLVK